MVGQSNSPKVDVAKTKGHRFTVREKDVKRT